MSIITRTGDQGNTCLMYKRKVSKCHPRVEAYGAVDELNAAVGLARATARHEFVRENLLPIQQDLVVLMGELATAVEDLPRYAKDGYPLVTAEMRGGPERLIGKIESVRASFKGWATPGGNLSSASLDVARTVCRRSAWRLCCRLAIEECPFAAAACLPRPGCRASRSGE